MNTVNIAAMNTNMSIRKLLMKDQNFDVWSFVPFHSCYSVFPDIGL